ncbi:autotransporter outer membrane beta-barrel domain-containing protein [Pseudomonas sp. dw_358]|uniref:autotransporter outer membrane beta-barrel domain-containing protein n=1 Tax=Pseudomonas sp. dw_358 TaxID=2720083 RepID=UPI001BD395F4|nr:autotransporter outer membrane beta-barrel domain-containing protein [Pseudomonas sp. dw_358]
MAAPLASGDSAVIQPGDAHQSGFLESGAARSTSTQTVLGLYNAAPVIWNAETVGLRSRFDELRREPSTTGLWLRAQGARYNVSPVGATGYELRHGGLTLGADATLSEQFTVGVLVGTSQSNLDFSKGTKGRIDSAYLGAYAGWADADGLYVDALIKANRFSNRADVQMSDSVQARGKYHDYGIGGSLELGKRFDLAEGWYAKPYGQMAALSVQGKDYRLSNGLEASNNSVRSLTGKLGGQFGRTLAMAGGGTLQPYVKIAATREFANGNQVRINDQTIDNSLAGSGVELGTGFVAQLSPAWQLNADFDYGRGERVDQAYGVSAGLRYAF